MISSFLLSFMFRYIITLLYFGNYILSHIAYPSATRKDCHQSPLSFVLRHDHLFREIFVRHYFSRICSHSYFPDTSDRRQGACINTSSHVYSSLLYNCLFLYSNIRPIFPNPIIRIAMPAITCLGILFMRMRPTSSAPIIIIRIVCVAFILMRLSYSDHSIF